MNWICTEASTESIVGWSACSLHRSFEKRLEYQQVMANVAASKHSLGSVVLRGSSVWVLLFFSPGFGNHGSSEEDKITVNYSYVTLQLMGLS